MINLASIVVVSLAFFPAQLRHLSHDLLIITDGSWAKENLDRFMTGPSWQKIEENIEPELVKRKYVLYEKNGDRFLFAPSIWQEDRWNRSRSFLKKLETALKQDGMLAIQSDPELFDASAIYLNSFGTFLGPNSAVAIQGKTTYTLSNGEKSITITGSSMPVTNRSALNSNPAKGHGTPLPSALSESDFNVAWPERYDLKRFGKYYQIQGCADGMKAALDVLKERFKSIDTENNGLHDAITKKLSGADLSKYLNHTVADMPSNVASDILGAAMTYFKSDSEAQAFLQNATLSSSSTILLLCVGLDGKNMYFSAQLP